MSYMVGGQVAGHIQEKKKAEQLLPLYSIATRSHASRAKSSLMCVCVYMYFFSYHPPEKL